MLFPNLLILLLSYKRGLTYNDDTIFGAIQAVVNSNKLVLAINQNNEIKLKYFA